MHIVQRMLVAVGAVSAIGASASQPAHAQANNFTFTMVVSPGAKGCIPSATGRVTISPLGPVENMHVELLHMPPNTGFDLFVIQVPNAPFGLSWYQGDIVTDTHGVGVGDFTGRFSKETFIVATGTDSAPIVDSFDAGTNPITKPVHTAHLGVWFDSAADASKAGCANTVTPFNGEHQAGIQAVNTGNFTKTSGPLLRLP